jgi:hypothetical protein
MEAPEAEQVHDGGEGEEEVDGLLRGKIPTQNRKT